MSEVELNAIMGAVANGIAYDAPPLVKNPTRLYIITDRSSHWTYERLALDIGPLSLKGASGRAAHYEDAKEWVDNDWTRHRNHILWAHYMTANPPPSG